MIDYWVENKGWNWEVLSELLHAMTLLRITLIAISESSEHEDKLVWRNSTNGELSVKLSIKKL